MRTANMLFGNVRLPIVKDAPADGKTYGRKDRTWVEVTGGSGITDAPADGSKYARKDNTWVTVLDGDDGAKPVQVTGLTLVAANWVADGSLKKYVLSHASITATSFVEVIPANASIAIVKAAEILPETDSAAGSVSIWATNTPSGDISVTINIYETE